MNEGPLVNMLGSVRERREAWKASHRGHRGDLGLIAMSGHFPIETRKSRVLSFFTNLHALPRVLLSPELPSPELLTLLLHSPVLSKTDAGS